MWLINFKIAEFVIIIVSERTQTYTERTKHQPIEFCQMNFNQPNLEHIKDQF